MDTSTYFDSIYRNAKFNGILIMDHSGIIQEINHAFNIRFGYTNEDLAGKNFAVLFTKEDQLKNRPESEIDRTIAEGSANDENYLVHKDGNKIWVTGESVLVSGNNERRIVKIIHNIHAQKQLERFLLQSHEFLDTIFDSVTDSALLVLDSRLRLVKANTAFSQLFEIKQPPNKGCRLTEIDHPFWSRADVKQLAVSFLVTQNSAEEKILEMETKTGVMKKIGFQGKVIEGVPGAERKLLIMIKVIN